jgi:hypothetical protein
VVDKESPFTAHRLSAHDKLRERLHNRLPATGERKFEITVDDAIMLISDYYYLRGQVEGLKEGGAMLKKFIEDGYRK